MERGHSDVRGKQSRTGSRLVKSATKGSEALRGVGISVGFVVGIPETLSHPMPTARGTGVVTGPALRRRDGLGAP